MVAHMPERPRLVALEGAAGAGKTTLQRHLAEAFAAKGFKVGVISEFSGSPLGRRLHDVAGFGEPKPAWSLGLGGLLAFLADKLHSLEAVAAAPGRVWVVDRLVTSQLILGTRGIKTGREKDRARAIISLTQSWVEETFSAESVLVILEAPLEVLAERLRRRIGRALGPDQLRLLEDEAGGYANLDAAPSGWSIARVSATAPAELLAGQLTTTITSRWAD